MSGAVYTIPVHRAFADSLARGLLARFGAKERGLAAGIVLAPSNRAARAIQDAFVRLSGGGLLLPRLVPIGDPALDERIGAALETMAVDEIVPPAVAPLERLMMLTRMISGTEGLGAAESLRLAFDLAATLDQLQIEEIDPVRLKTFAAELPDLAAHWQKSLDRLAVILADWPARLAALGRIDLADRRNRLLGLVARRWRDAPPPGFVCAAGVTTSAPAVARLLRTVLRLDDGIVVLPGLDLDMRDDEWDALGPHSGAADRPAPPSLETHPQFHLKRLLDRLGVARGEVRHWRRRGGRDAPPSRTRVIQQVMTPAAFTRRWQELGPAARRLAKVRALELANPAEEAQAIALALRGALETPGRTAALVTPDRALARRVSAHLRRWDIVADDSAGQPLAQTPPGTFLLALARAASEEFAPVALLALLKHPLAMAGPGRLAWLDGVRQLDLALRGPRPPAGLAGITAFLSSDGGDSRAKSRAAPWWVGVASRLAPLEAAFAADDGLASLLAALRNAVGDIGGDDVWKGTAGRAAAEALEELESAAVHGPDRVEPADLTAILARVMETIAVRPPYGQHGRLFIWGLLEARLQQADLMVLGGLNEGVWPALPAPDAWLAPRLRNELDLPSLDRRTGLAAHDFASALGAPEVLVTRARRDTRSPAIASRFWLRLEAMTGGVSRAHALRHWARALDRPSGFDPAERPRPSPERRPREVYVTDLDRLKADPYAFYARRILGLRSLDIVDADPSAAWRGSAVHAVLEAWMTEDDCDPARLRPRAEAFLETARSHPVMRSLWQPRLVEAVDFIAAQVDANRLAGRRPRSAETEGQCEIAGITVRGRADRIDDCGDGQLVIVDYKTGSPPKVGAIEHGFTLQLGLLGLIAEAGGFAGITGRAAGFEYWSLARDRKGFGYVWNAVRPRTGGTAEAFLRRTREEFEQSAARWLTGNEPFVARLHPQYAPYGDFDQLMRLDEWYGRSG